MHWGKGKGDMPILCLLLWRKSGTPWHPYYFPNPELNRRKAVGELSGETCQIPGISCHQTSIGLEKSVVGEGKVSDLVVRTLSLR